MNDPRKQCTCSPGQKGTVYPSILGYHCKTCRGLVHRHEAFNRLMLQVEDLQGELEALQMGIALEMGMAQCGCCRTWRKEADMFNPIYDDPICIPCLSDGKETPPDQLDLDEGELREYETALIKFITKNDKVPEIRRRFYTYADGTKLAKPWLEMAQRYLP